MRRKSFDAMPCPIARSLERVGEWWSMLILRDALHGMTRFDQFERSLGIAPNMLARRLDALMEAGLLQRRRYSEHPPRYEYLPTPRGRDFKPVLIALLAWGNRHFAPEGASVVLIDRRTGRTVEPLLVDAGSGQPITDTDHCFAAGPAASARTRQRYADSARDAAPKRSKAARERARSRGRSAAAER